MQLTVTLQFFAFVSLSHFVAQWNTIQVLLNLCLPGCSPNKPQITPFFYFNQLSVSEMLANNPIGQTVSEQMPLKA